jgi:hypothetical protein
MIRIFWMAFMVLIAVPGGVAFHPAAASQSSLVEVKRTQMDRYLHCKKMFGEWTVRFSDDPRVPGKRGIIPETGLNRVIISIRPAGHFDVSYRCYRGFCLNEVIRKGVYKVTENVDSTLKLEVSIRSSKETIISFCGIEIDDIHPVIRDETYEQPYLLDAELMDNDLYIMAVDNTDQFFYYHLVRFQMLDPTASQLPVSNLIFSNMLTMLLTYTLHIFLHTPT